MSLLPSPWTALFAVVDAIADGITLAAKTLCPMDHTGVERARAAADAFAEAEAEEEVWEPGRLNTYVSAPLGAAVETGHDIGLSWACEMFPQFTKSSAASSAAADPSPDAPTRFAAGSGGEGPGPDSVIPQTVGPGQPDMHPAAVYSRLYVEQAREREARQRSARLLQSDPGEVFTPSPGDEQATSDLGAKDTGREGYLSELIPELRARADMFKAIED